MYQDTFYQTRSLVIAFDWVSVILKNRIYS